MTMTLKHHAENDPEVFHFVRDHQAVDPKRGCTRVRELARLWYRVHGESRTLRAQN